MIRSQFRFMWLLLLTGLVVGCSSIDNSTTNVEWQSHQQRLSTITDYRVSGKLGYISPDERQSLNFVWTHSPSKSQLRLTSFLGQTVLNMTVTPQGARVDTYDDQQFEAQSAEQLIYRLTGLQLPIDPLSSWLLGSPQNADDYQLNQTNTLDWLDKTINAQRWHLDYQSYQDINVKGTTLPLPHKLKLTQDTTTINLVISKWTVK